MNQIQNTLIQVIADTSKSQDAEIFLKNFFTTSELETFSKRLAIAYWLSKGRSYTNIKENLKVSSATIATVQEMMKSPGFQHALKIIQADEWAVAWSTRIKKFVGK